MSRYSPEPYQADGGFTIVGLPILFAVLAIAGVMLGGIAGFISQWFYLIFVFPAVIGFGLLGAAWLGNRVGKMRNAGIGFVAGLFAACVAMGTMHYVEYQMTISKAAGELRQANPGGGGATAEQAVRSIGFFQYLNLAAKEGVTIGRRGSGINLGYWGTWIYWTVELLGVAVLALIGTVGVAVQPFCRRCESWKDETTLGHLTGDPERAKGALEAGRIDDLADHDPDPSRGHLLVTMSHCKSCGGRTPVDVKLQQVTKNAKGEEEKSELVHVTYPGEAMAELEDLFGVARGRRRPLRDLDDEAERPRRRSARDEDDEDDRPRRRAARDEEGEDDRPRRREVTDRPRARDDEDRPRRSAREDEDDRPRRRDRDEDDRPRRPDRDRDDRPRQRDDDY